jgi:hypothetical protein
MGLVKHRDWIPFIAKTEQPELVQQALLRRILADQASTAFGIDHRFSALLTYEEFVREVPVCTYEDLRPSIEAQEQTKEPLLTAGQPILFAQTSGTTGKPKYVPILKETAEGMRLYQRLFGYAQCQGVPTIYQGNVLVITGQTVEGHLPGGTPFGSMSGLLFDCLPAAIRRKSVLSEGLPAILDYRQRYLYMAARALADPSLSVLATPNPSTILKLLELIRSEFVALLDAISPGSSPGFLSEHTRCTASSERLSWLRSLIGQEARLDFAALWPDLQAVVTWMGGNCAVLIPKLRSLLPQCASVIEMGYLSSECLGSLNVDVVNNRCVPTFHENFFEFVEVGEQEELCRDPIRLHQIQEGRKYSVIVTTSNGLYRYAMNDIVEVTGRFNRTPTIRFVQKGKGVTNITGEKLYEHQVIEAVEEVLKACGITCEFYVMLASVEDFRYTLYLEHVPLQVDLGPFLEERLAEVNVEYKAKRDSGRLQPIRVFHLPPGAGEAYRQHCVNSGQREAQFKVIKLQYAHDCPFDFEGYRR